MHVSRVLRVSRLFAKDSLLVAAAVLAGVVLATTTHTRRHGNTGHLLKDRPDRLLKAAQTLHLVVLLTLAAPNHAHSMGLWGKERIRIQSGGIGGREYTH